MRYPKRERLCSEVPCRPIQGHLRVLRSKVQRRRGTPVRRPVLWPCLPACTVRSSVGSSLGPSRRSGPNAVRWSSTLLPEPASDPGRAAVRPRGFAQPLRSYEDRARGAGAVPFGCHLFRSRRRRDGPSGLSQPFLAVREPKVGTLRSMSTRILKYKSHKT
jgi:hypothetical protein